MRLRLRVSHPTSDSDASGSSGSGPEHQARVQSSELKAIGLRKWQPPSIQSESNHSIAYWQASASAKLKTPNRMTS